jgi:hypothetical protein
VKLHQLLDESGLTQAFKKGMQDPVGTAKDLARKSFTGTSTKQPAAAESPYDVIPDNRSMKDIIKRVLGKQDLEPYQIKLLQDLDRRL